MRSATTSIVRAVAAFLLLSLAGPGFAQSFTVSSITTADLGKVQSATTGDTVFRIDSATGNVTRQSGTGIRVTNASTRALVTIACGTEKQCDTDGAKIVITKIGTPTKRAGALTNFNVSVSGATATLATTPSGTSTLTFNVGPIGKSSSKTFWLGADLPIKADDSGLATGDATSGFVVTISKTNGSSAVSANGSVTARVFRPITIGLTSNMSFGTISRPFTGTGTYSLDSGTGVRNLTGQGVQGLSPTIRSAYTVSGEGGQVFSVSIPATFNLTRTGGSITVTTNNTVAGTQVLSGALGSAGSFPFYVGGSFPLDSAMALGAYTASFAVTVQYN